MTTAEEIRLAIEALRDEACATQKPQIRDIGMCRVWVLVRNDGNFEVWVHGRGTCNDVVNGFFRLIPWNWQYKEVKTFTDDRSADDVIIRCYLFTPPKTPHRDE